MTRTIVTARIASCSSSDSETSHKTEKGPHAPTLNALANMNLLQRRTADVSNDLDLFVYDSSDHELDSQAGLSESRGRPRGSVKRRGSLLRRSPEVGLDLKYPQIRRGRSAGPKAKLLHKAKGEAEIEAQRQQEAQDDYEIADFITVPPLYSAKRDRGTILPDRQDRLVSSTTLLIPGTQPLPSILRSPQTIDVAVETVPRLTFARRPSNTAGSDSLTPSPMHASTSRMTASPASPRETRRLSFAVDCTKPIKVRRRNKSATEVSYGALRSEGEAVHKQKSRRPSSGSLSGSNLALDSPTISIGSYTSTGPSTSRPMPASALSLPSLNINTPRKSRSASGSRSRSASFSSPSPIFFLPFAGKAATQSEGSSAGLSPTRLLASAASTVTLCKICATYHSPTSQSSTKQAGEDSESVTTTDATWWGATPRRRSLPELLLYAGGAKRGNEALNHFESSGKQSHTPTASSTKVGSVRGRIMGRGRSESDTRALLWSIQASAGKIL
ncbi:hypothetical protein BCV69DRAFT_300103 [Microstroma glucosiphilum]|uniref:Uncharacterized protein n=1 Tax=Pseudomicrostroma glucosiphilum TaxID=1684307 RepID=A0A316U3C0_9BASI|nr:hypothetical protein BCV69DRAFT_300103 [Pseudomicrostroma glucosiphilum]PWN19796.1 hypothetical protein BCV69DRAFT_300103 [Pseudomicrostroma glucosiphilum]